MSPVPPRLYFKQAFNINMTGHEGRILLVDKRVMVPYRETRGAMKNKNEIVCLRSWNC